MGNHKLLKLASTGIITATVINEIIDRNAKLKNKCNDIKGKYYNSDNGKIYYTVSGEGKPLLLIHDLDSFSSNYEWNEILSDLSKTNKVYAIDLLGCGQSDHPANTYTNYLYIKIIEDFISNVICEKTNVVCHHDSSSVVLMSTLLDSKLFNKIIIINPCDYKKMDQQSNRLDLFFKRLYYLPIIGTSLYNIHIQETNILERLQGYFIDSSLVDKYLDLYYEISHRKHSKGRYLYASKKCKFLDVKLDRAISQAKNVYLIVGEEYDKDNEIANSYIELNKKIKVTTLLQTKLLPQLENPEQTIKAITEIL